MKRKMKKRKKGVDKSKAPCYYVAVVRAQPQTTTKYARVVELVDSLDSGSSAHSGRGGSTPPSRTIQKDFRKEVLFLFEERIPPAMQVRSKKLYFCLEKKNLQ